MGQANPMRHAHSSPGGSASQYATWPASQTNCRVVERYRVTQNLSNQSLLMAQKERRKEAKKERDTAKPQIFFKIPKQIILQEVKPSWSCGTGNRDLWP